MGRRSYRPPRHRNTYESYFFIGAIWDLGFAWISGTIGDWLRDRPRIGSTGTRAEGVTYLDCPHGRIAEVGGVWAESLRAEPDEIPGSKPVYGAQGDG
jgi:hypothetical protein